MRQGWSSGWNQRAEQKHVLILKVVLRRSALHFGSIVFASQLTRIQLPAFAWQAGTFREVFQPVELTPVDFVRLLDLAERRFVPEGEHLSEAGRVQDEVFLIVEGTAEVHDRIIYDT